MFEILALAPKSNALTDFFFKSGPFIYPLILTSVAGVMAVIYKYLSSPQAASSHQVCHAASPPFRSPRKTTTPRCVKSRQDKAPWRDSPP